MSAALMNFIFELFIGITQSNNLQILQRPHCPHLQSLLPQVWKMGTWGADRHAYKMIPLSSSTHTWYTVSISFHNKPRKTFIVKLHKEAKSQYRFIEWVLCILDNYKRVSELCIKTSLYSPYHQLSVPESGPAAILHGYAISTISLLL